MFKKIRCLAIIVVLVVSLLPSYRAFALNYSGSQGNPVTFETLEETRASSPVAVAQLETNNGKTFKSHPVLDNYPKGTTYVYRSPNMYGGRAAARRNRVLRDSRGRHGRGRGRRRAARSVAGPIIQVN